MGDLYLVAETPGEGAEPLPCHECLNYVLLLASYTVGVNTSFSWSFCISLWSMFGRGSMCVSEPLKCSSDKLKRAEAYKKSRSLTALFAHQEKTRPFGLCGICEFSSQLWTAVLEVGFSSKSDLVSVPHEGADF